MIISCPNCQKRYSIPDHFIGDQGREVRCDACGHQWFYKNKTDETITDKSKDNVFFNPPSVQNNKSKKQSTGYGWILLTITFLSLIGTAFFLQDKIVTHFPKTAILYQIFGFKDSNNHLGFLEFSKIQPLFQEYESGNQEIVVSGTLSNPLKETVSIKGISIKVLGQCDKASLKTKFLHFIKGDQGTKNCQLLEWTFEPSDTKLMESEEISFETKAPRQVIGAHRIMVSVF